MPENHIWLSKDVSLSGEERAESALGETYGQGAYT